MSLSPGPTREGFGAAGAERGDSENEGDDVCAPWGAGP